jgi:hypothetical protein
MTRDAAPIVFVVVGFLLGVAATLLAARSSDFLAIAREVAKMLRLRRNHRMHAPFGPLGD